MPIQIASISFQNLSRPVLLVLAVCCGRCAAMLASMTLNSVSMVVGLSVDRNGIAASAGVISHHCPAGELGSEKHR